MTEVVTNFKPDPVPCPCLCGLVARPQKRTRKDGLYHAVGCKCVRCNGAKIRRSGNDGQRSSAKRAGVKKVGSLFAGHEEMYDGETRIEIKTGAQVRPMVTAFDKCKGQSEASRPIGDVRPFVLHVRPQPSGKRQLTTFESTSDEEYDQALYAMCMQRGIQVP